MRLNKVVVVLAILFIIGTSDVFAQDLSNNTFGKGIRMMTRDSSLSLKFGLRFSTLYEVFYIKETKKYADNLLIRRFRLKFDGHAVSPKLIYKVEIGVSNRDIGGVDSNTNGAPRLLLDAVLKWNFAGNFILWFGQTKLPGNRERVISSQKLQFVDRSLLNSRINLDRDKGLQLHYHHNWGKAVIREIVSISKGEGRNITIKNKDGYDYTGRIELLPMGLFSQKGDYFEADIVREPNPKLALGITYDYNVGAERSRGQLGPWLHESRNLSTWFADAIYKHNGFSALTEYASRQTEGNAAVETDSTGTVTQAFYTGRAFVGQIAYLFKNNFEIAGRYAMLQQDPDTQREDITQYTLGVSKYIVGHSLKVQSDITLQEVVNSPDQWLFRFQVEMAF